MFKLLFTILLSALSFFASAQLSKGVVDLLSKQFRLDVKTSNFKQTHFIESHYPGYHFVYDTAYEIYENYFPDTKVIVVVFKGSVGIPHVNPNRRKVYLYNTKTKSIQFFRSSKAYIKFLNTSTKPINNLDKIMLYICTMKSKIRKSIWSKVPAFGDKYDVSLEENSILYINSFDNYIFPSHQFLPPTLCNGLSYNTSPLIAKKSNINNVYLHMGNVPRNFKKGQCSTVYEFNFIFDDSGKIKKINMQKL